jgi:hypothetical protein
MRNQITFRLPSQFRETIVWFRSPFLSPRLAPVGSVGDPMGGDRIEQTLVKHLAAGGVLFALHGDHRLKGPECLDGSLEADRSRFDPVSGRREATRLGQSGRQMPFP